MIIYSFCAAFTSSGVFCSGFWWDQVTPGDRFIQGLTDRSKTMVLSSRAYCTSSKYHRAFRKWKEFAVCKLRETSFPVDPSHIALFLQHLSSRPSLPAWLILPSTASTGPMIWPGFHPQLVSRKRLRRRLIPKRQFCSRKRQIGSQENSCHCRCQPYRAYFFRSYP